ncbi:MAG: Clp protease ClpP [Rhizobiaceae bacterium]|nr:Clp protease ClpP [Rhizobiaceae bacterium]
MTKIELRLHGVVGDDFDAARVQTALKAGGDVTVTLNSGGGIASEGAAIYALLAAHPGRVTVDVIGIAASAASLIAMAGDAITMRAGAVLMIHDPMNITVGNSSDHAKTIEELEAYAKSYAKIYAARSGKSEKQCRELMKSETWFDGEQAVAAGFATHTDSRQAEPFAHYNYERYRHAAPAFAAARNEKAGWKRAIMDAQARRDAFVVRG